MILTKEYVQNYIKTNNIDISQPFVLNLSYDNIESIEVGAFNGLVRLRTLFLHNNNLTNIKTGTFNRLFSLNTLYLHNNNLTSVDNVFNRLVKLERLSLDDNKLTSVKNAFNGLVNLNTLSLYNNNLSNVDNVFDGLDNLESLCLDKNNLTSIDISNNKKLSYISVDTETKVYINKGQIDLMKKRYIANYEVVGDSVSYSDHINSYTNSLNKNNIDSFQKGQEAMNNLAKVCQESLPILEKCYIENKAIMDSIQDIMKKFNF